MKKQHFDCSCHDLSHTVRFTYEAKQPRKGSADEPPYMYIDYHLNPYHSFFGRLKIAFLYLFGKESKHGAWDCTMISFDDAPRFRQLAEAYERDVIEFTQGREHPNESGRNSSTAD
jgi:hypothetical protein